MPNGPDFSTIDSQPKVEALLRQGNLERLLLLPSEFGGRDVPENLLYVPVGFAAVKAGIDNNIIAPLISQGNVSRYSAVPQYQGKSFIPVAIVITASDPGQFSTTIKIWGDALSRK